MSYFLRDKEMTKNAKNKTLNAESTHTNEVQVSNTLVKSLILFFEAFGFSQNQAFEGTSISALSLTDVDGYVSESNYDRFFYNCSQLANDPFFGLHLGAKLTLQQLGVLGYLLMNSNSFGRSLRAYECFQSSLGESLVLSTKIIGRTARVFFKIYGGELTGFHRIESFYSALQCACLELTGRPLEYIRIGTRRKIHLQSEEYFKVVGTAPTEADSEFVEFDAIYLDLPIINSIPELTDIFEDHLKSKIDKSQSNLFSRQVKRELARRLGQEKREDLASLSRFFGMSERAFQLKLEKEDKTFREIYDEARADFAIRFLKNGSSMAEIAYALGFSEPSAFQRAFKRWTGMTPGQARTKNVLS